LAYPRIRVLFDALINVQVNLAGLASYLRDEASEYTGLDHRRYVPPAKIFHRVAGHPAVPKDLQWRAKLEEVPQLWIECADQYWEWWLSLRDFSEVAKQACIDAAPDLDAGEANPLSRQSTRLRESLLRAENSANRRILYGWNPLKYPTDIPDVMVKAAVDLFEWVERLRPLATLEGQPASKPEADVASEIQDPAARPVRRGYQEATEYLLGLQKSGLKWTSHNKMAEIASCLPSVLTNAIAKSPELQAYRDAARATASAAKSIDPPVGLDASTIAGDPDQAPGAALEQAQVIAMRPTMLAMLLDGATDFARSKINGMTEREQDELCDDLSGTRVDQREARIKLLRESIDSEKPSRTPSLPDRKSARDRS